jgi:lipopolysaccharide export system protein LptA
MKFQFILFFIITSSCLIFAQSEDIIHITGEKYIGKTVNGESIREVQGNVVLTQGNVRVTCDTAIQYIANNNAKLIGNVVIVQDTVTITTDSGYYYGTEKRAEASSGIKLNDKKVILTADSGSYFFNDKIAVFRHNVTLYDTTTTLTSDKLIYYKSKDLMVATKNVKVVDDQNIIYADSVDFYRKSRISFANKNVRIKNLKNNVMIFGDHLEDYAKRNYTLVDKNPLMIQIDTTYLNSNHRSMDSLNFELDTLVIKSNKMESFRDSSIYKAEDSVRIVRGDFASRNDFTLYYKKRQKIITYKLGENNSQPILWFSNSQLTGDSVTIYLVDNKINHLEVDKNAFVLSQDSTYKKRFNQLSGSKVMAYFNNNQLIKTEVFGGVHSIYYLFDGQTKNGLTKSSAERAIINFVNRRVNTVRLYGSPTSEYYPEKMVNGNEPAFTLPHYVFYNNRPQKYELLKTIKASF